MRTTADLHIVRSLVLAITTLVYLGCNKTSADGAFFAALTLRLASRGRIALDTPLFDILPQLHIDALHWITPRMLLSHTSGVGEYDTPFMTSLVREPLRVRTRDDWLDVIRRNPPHRDEAGRFRYSDLNYVLLAMVLDARTANGAYDAIVKEYLTPLHLSGTAPSIAPVIDSLVTGYDGAGSMFGTDAMVQNGKLIPFVAAWHSRTRSGQPSSPVHPAFPIPRRRGVAWASTWAEAHSACTWGISGYMPGYVSWVRWYDSLGISIAIQANATDSLRLPDDGFHWVDSIATRVGFRCR